MAFSFTRTRNQVAALVLGKLAVMPIGGTARTADSDLVYEAIDLRLKELHKLGIVWRKVDPIALSFTVTAAVNSASASVDIVFPIALTIQDTSQDSPVRLIGPREYHAIPLKTETGLPTKAIWTGGANFTFWPVPTASTTAKLIYEKYADDTSASAAIDVDVSMLRSIRDMICYDLGDHYGKSEQTLLRYKQESEKAERDIRKLGALRLDYDPVMVEDYYARPTRRATDY